VGCGKCIDACPVSFRDHSCGVLVRSVKEQTVEEVWHLLYPQLDFLRSIGGLTVSGGEALLQSEALAGLLRLCKKEGIHTAVETSGALPKKYIKDVVELTDCWLYGLRPTPAYTPPHAQQIAKNLACLSKAGSRIIIRTPVIAGITDLSASLEQIAGIMQVNGLYEIQLLPFNQETSHYYNALGQKCLVGDDAIVSPERMEAVRTFFLKQNFSVKIIK
jgi:pyruvate formate lyase activating enzyme